jgi:hypothetical protein
MRIEPKTSEMRQEVNGFTRVLELTSPFDMRDSNPKKNYDIHGMNLKCVLVKDGKAVCFLAHLPVYLKHVADEQYFGDKRRFNPFEGMGADVGYHSPTPKYKEQTVISDKCPYIGCACYYDGSSLRGEEWYEEFLKEGLDHIWKKLEVEWEELFGGKV